MESKEYRELRKAANMAVGYIAGVVSRCETDAEADARIRLNALQYVLQTLNMALAVGDKNDQEHD